MAGRGFGRDSVFAGAQHSSGFGVSGSSAAIVGWCACAERVTRCVCRVRAITFNRFGHSESTAVMPNRFGHSVRSRALLHGFTSYGTRLRRRPWTKRLGVAAPSSCPTNDPRGSVSSSMHERPNDVAGYGGNLFCNSGNNGCLTCTTTTERTFITSATTFASAS